MATRIRLTDLEQRIMDHVFQSHDGYERIEDLLLALGADRNQFVDALESLEGEGYLSVSNLDGNVVVASQDPVAILAQEKPMSMMIYSSRVGHC